MIKEQEMCHTRKGRECQDRPVKRIKEDRATLLSQVYAVEEQEVTDTK